MSRVLLIVAQLLLASVLFAQNVVAWGANTMGQSSVPAGLSGTESVALGAAHGMALRSDGTVGGWGDNFFGQSSPPPISGVIAISAGYQHSLALKSDGTVVAWGYNASGQCNVPAGLTGVVAVHGGAYHSLALKSDGTVVAWGENSNGQCNVPAGLTGVVAIAAGRSGHHSVALKSDGTVVAWGLNSDNQATVPVGLTQVVAIAAGEVHTTALKSDGTVVVWGNNDSGQGMIPAGLTGVVAIAAGNYHNLALKGDGTVVGWGNNSYGQATPPVGLSDVVKITAGTELSLAMTSSGEVVIWGDDTNPAFTVPVSVSGLKQVEAGAIHSLLLRSNGSVVAWGDNTDGQLAIPGGLLATQVAAGFYHTVALKADGTVVAWGRNTSGQCDVPAGLTGVVQVAAGGNLSAALKGDGTVLVWGEDSAAETVPDGLFGITRIAVGTTHVLAMDIMEVIAWGENTYGQGVVPQAAAQGMAFDAGPRHNLVVKPDGTVIAWGQDTFGQSTVPAGLNSVAEVAAGGEFSLAMKTDRTLVAWGDNSYGQSNIPGWLQGTVKAFCPGTAHVVALVNGKRAPVANAGLDRRVECTGLLNSVTLFGNASYDPDGDPITYKWWYGGQVVATDSTPTFQLPKGTHTFALSVTDTEGRMSYDFVTIKVEFVNGVLRSLGADYEEFIGGYGTTGVVTLWSAPIFRPVSVAMSSDNAKLWVPEEVIFGRGYIQAYFPVRSGTVTSDTAATATASFNSVTKTFTFTLLPGGLQSFLVQPSTTITGGQSATGKVTLSGIPGTSGRRVYLTSSNPAVQVPASVLVPPGATFVTFSITTSAVVSPTQVDVIARAGTVQRKVTITVNP